MNKVSFERKKHQQCIQLNDGVVFVERGFVKISFPVFHWRCTGKCNGIFFAFHYFEKCYRIFCGWVAKNQRIVVEFVHVIILNVFVVKSINEPDENTGEKFEIKKKMSNKRLKMFELKNAEQVNEQIEKKQIEKRKKNFFHKSN